MGIKRSICVIAFVNALAVQTTASWARAQPKKPRQPAAAPAATEPALPSRLARLRYNNPGLTVDLGVGLWGQPLPIDYDGDGKADVLIGWAGRPEGGVNYYERASPSDPRSLQFKPGRRVSDFVTDLQSSSALGRWFVTSNSSWYPEFTTRGIAVRKAIPFKPPFYTFKRFTRWTYYDYDGDGTVDLVIAAFDQREAGWDDAYDDKGNWKNGPQRTTFYWVKNTGSVDQPVFGTPQQIMAGEKPMEVLGLPSVNFADFDGDGLPDLISSEGLDSFTFFKNVGSRSAPRFSPGQPLTNDGQVIHMDLEMITPTEMDYDNDGKPDLLVGQEDGRVALMRNTGKSHDGMPDFELPAFLQQEAVELKSGVLNTPFGADLDGDGKMDLICGNSAGYIQWFKNLGGDPPKWSAPQSLEADGLTIRIQGGSNGSIQGPLEAKWGYTAVCVADWNMDGLPDLVINSIWGKVLWYQNVGTRTAPKFAAAQPVQVEWNGPPRKPAWNWWNPSDNELATQWRSSVQVLDLTGDGLPDLVTLDEDGYLAMFERLKGADGQLKLLPGKRVFHVEPGAPNVLDQAHTIKSSDENGDGKNDQSNLDANGRIAFHYQVPGTTTQSVKWVRRAGDQRYLDPDNATALRLESGWAGRSGRRKFTFCDWDGDGKLDLIVNGSNANFFKNLSSDPKRFVFRDMGPVDGLRLAGHDTCPAAVDFTGSGVPDLVIGAEDGFFYFLTNPNRKGGR